jgi:hypothetical protein
VFEWVRSDVELVRDVTVSDWIVSTLEPTSYLTVSLSSCLSDIQLAEEASVRNTLNPRPS